MPEIMKGAYLCRKRVKKGSCGARGKRGIQSERGSLRGSALKKLFDKGIDVVPF